MLSISPLKIDFTLRRYIELLDTINRLEIPVYGIRDWIEKSPEKGILIRHDVDRKVSNSLRVAEIDHQYGFKTTFNFRYTSSSFVPQIIKRISKMGHEIGYHYEDFSRHKGDIIKAEKSFARHLSLLRKIADVKTITMHGHLLSPLDNRDMWKSLSFKDFNLIGEAFLTINYKDIYYFTDSGRNWSKDSANLRDNVITNKVLPEVNSTEDLCSFIDKNSESSISIVTHPERWSSSYLDWLMQYVFDMLSITIKLFLIKFRNQD